MESWTILICIISIQTFSTTNATISSNSHSKCCPIGSSYNSTNRSCLKTDTFNDTHRSKIGLPQCKVITDHKLNRTDEAILASNHCTDLTVDGRAVVRICEDLSVCDSLRCVRKCCPDGQSFVNGSNCEDTFQHGIDMDVLGEIMEDLSGDFALIHGYTTGVYLPDSLNFSLDSLGNFHTFDPEETAIYPPKEESYCVEHATKDGIEYGHVIFRIFPKEDPGEPLPTKYTLNRWAMVVSGFFLVLTILHYVYSGQIQNVFGKMLVSFCVALLLLYLLLVFMTFTEVKLHYRKTLIACKFVGFSILYLMFCCFVWLQIMSYDIFRKFRTSRSSLSTGEKHRELKIFLLYSAYGWGVPLLYTLLLVFLHIYDFLPTSLGIEIGITRCYLEKGNYADLVFHILPITVIQLVNCVFFVKTVRYCLKVKREIQRMIETNANVKSKQKFFASKKRFGLILKLSVTMGVSFLLEVISSFFDFKPNPITETIEVIWDVINCLQGLFIFVIFVCKKRNLRKCQKSSAVERIRRISLSSATSRMTNLSSRRSRDTTRQNRLK